MTKRFRHLIRDDAGFSLMELLMAMALGSIVLTAVMVVFTNGLSGTAKVTDRIDAVQSARLASDQMTSLLQSAVCNNGYTPVTTATATAVTFTANQGGPDAAPTQYRLRWDNATNKIFQDTFVVNATTGVFPTTPTSTKTIATNVTPEDGITMFSYYPYNSSTGVLATSPLTAPVTDANALKSIATVGIDILAQPEKTKTSDPRSTAVEATAAVGAVDPSNPTQGTQC